MAMNFQRRRAPIACNFCRQRKRKCDGHKPACRLCSLAGVTCDYQDPSAAAAVAAVTENARSGQKENGGGNGKKSATTADMMRRLDELEKLIREQHTAAAPVEAAKTPAPKDPWYPPINMDNDPGVAAFLSTMWIPPEMPLLQQTQPQQQTPNNPSPGTLDQTNMQWSPGSGGPNVGAQQIEEEQSTIPIGHLTPTSSLFSLDQIKKLIGEYPEDFFFQIESTRNADPPIPESELNLEKSATDPLLAAFFAEIHPHFPILNPDSFENFFDSVMYDGAGDDSSRALCLIILALGKLASHRQARSPGQYQEDDGFEYFARAYYRLSTQWITSFDFNLPLASGLVYCAIYMCYLERPLHGWRLIYMASSKVQMLANQASYDTNTQEEIDYLGRLCWTCFLLECDTLAEFHLPRSGIETMMENMPFPCFANGIDSDGLSFLAICSIRRLLNRIHRSIYATSYHPKGALGSNSTSSSAAAQISRVAFLETICTELAHQLDDWYHSLPDSIKPDLTHNTPVNLHDGWLRLRYWSARHIICRPCLVYAATLPENVPVPSYVMRHSEICVTSCRNYIETATFVLKERTQYTWMTIQASLACAFVLTIAAGSSLLKGFVPDITILLGKVTSATQAWAAPGSSAESIGWILNTITQKQRLLGRSVRSGSLTNSSSTGIGDITMKT